MSSTNSYEGMLLTKCATLSRLADLKSRYKYLQRPLEETSLPSVLQYVSRWEPEQQAKFATTVGLLMGQGIVTAACLQTLTKDAVVKNGTSTRNLCPAFE